MSWKEPDFNMTMRANRAMQTTPTSTPITIATVGLCSEGLPGEEGT